MGIKIRIVSLFIIMTLVAGVTVGCSSGFIPKGKTEPLPPVVTPAGPSALAPTNGLVQSNEGGAVTIDVKWLGQNSGSLVFQVDMNTHSVDLDVYDLGKLATLRDDSGKEYKPSSWQSAAGGHHRGGTLAFTIADSVKQSTAKSIELVVRDVAGIKERNFKWELGR